MKLIHLLVVLFAMALCVSQTDAQWTQIGPSGRGIGEIAIGNTRMYAITTDSGSVFRSTDGGANWSQIVPSTGTHIAVAPNGFVYSIMTSLDNLYRSTDGGSSWTNLNVLEHTTSGLPPGDPSTVECVAVGPSGWVFFGQAFQTGQMYGTTKDAPFMSTDNGVSWTWPSGTVGGGGFAFRGNFVLTSGNHWGWELPKGHFAVSSDSGRTWRETYQAYGGISRFVWCSNGNMLAYVEPAPINGTLFLSADTGAHWSTVGILKASALLALPQSGVLVGTDTSGIYLFTDNGDSLGTRNQGLTDLHIHTFAMDSSGYVYAGTNKGVWRRPLFEIVSVSQPPDFPKAFRLEQNYPNPFNPSTTIAYSIPGSRAAGVGSMETKLVVYDILGGEVAVLVNEKKMPGRYEAQFDGSGLASGMYLYRLTTGPYLECRKMVLMK
jgi:hypothetical protein